MKKQSVNFDDFDHTPIEDIQSIESEGQIIKLWARDLWLDVLWQDKIAKDKYNAKSIACLKDLDGNKIGTTEFSRKTYLELRKYKKKGTPIEVLAKVIKIEKKDYFINGLKLLEHRAGDLPLRQIQASITEIKLVKKFLAITAAEFKKGNRHGLLEAIREAIISKFGIIGTDIDELYDDAINAIICQAFSGGKVGNTNAKINTCIIGPPAGGKKLLWEIAKFLNFVSEEAQSMRVTPRGITAGMDKNTSMGSIPLANKGVFGIQDFHICKEKEEILPIFADVMEDGICIITGANRYKFEAETAIHIDINRLSDLHLDKATSKNVATDVSLPTNIISRFDFIIELNRDPELQYQKATQLLAKSFHRETRNSKIEEYSRKQGIAFERFLKLIMAFIVTEFKNVDTKPVEIYMSKKFSKIIEINKENIKKMPEMSMFPIRLSNSLLKFVRAFTRIQLLDEANIEAVDMALHLLSRKLDFLKNVNAKFLVPQYRTKGKMAFAKWLVDRYGSKTFSPKEIIKKYKEEGFPCGEVKERMLRNWIKAVAYKEKQNVWKIKDHILEKFS